ncbi:ligase-associated DNA damage response endonuclease PdeM [Rhodohalobacter sp. 614A]|uniref:ligase-associated DNA damage response endonuclease PdeM n=1 Tax=Rhodohalobacter sp. 614A TaxID=2908649 RepID=UPI001F1F38BD|nr:ligase-associated DNA damage response endonuclease PdeM [Rhodohalobacter sp. 614A]
MSSSITKIVQNQTWELLPEKAVFWKNRKTLIITDLHIGKSGHFRKSGIAAPAGINAKTLSRLGNLIESLQPDGLLILGDLFHSKANREWLEFEAWLEGFGTLDIQLVTGNHDLLHQSFYESANITVHEKLEINDFLFVHDPQELSGLKPSTTVVAGHIHPGISIKGKGRQSLRFPCFLFSDEKILLPAFGEFTGLHTIKPEEDEQVYAIVEESILEL